MVSAPTYSPDLAEALLRLAENQFYGIYHLTNTSFCNRVELAREVLGLQKMHDYPQLRAVTQQELRLPAKRPRFSGMENLAWKVHGFPPLRPWQEALADHFSHLKVAS